ncbi:TetR-like C-terminal domain-containing protein [Streptomyces sp. NPDC001902]
MTGGSVCALAEAYRAWAVRRPHRYLLVQRTPVPGCTAPADTVERARAALGPFLGVFATASPTAAVLPVVEETGSWARRDAVAAWVTTHTGERAAAAPGVPLAGAVLAWSHLHGAVGLETAGQFEGMGHSGAMLLTARIDSWRTPSGAPEPGPKGSERLRRAPKGSEGPRDLGAVSRIS